MPKATASLLEYDFGNVPVLNDMSKAPTKQFTISNEGTADLKITGATVKLLEGC